MKTSRKSASAVSNGKSMRCHRAATDRLHIGNRWINHAGLGYYDNTARYFDALTVRFTAADRLEWKTPQLSPWSHCAGNPVKFIDPDGLEIAVVGRDGKCYNIVYNFKNGEYVSETETDDEFVRQVLSNINIISGGGCVGWALIFSLQMNRETVKIAEGNKINFSREDKTVHWNPTESEVSFVAYEDGQILPEKSRPFINLAHELFHAEDYVNKHMDFTPWYSGILADGTPFTEIVGEKYAIFGENFIRAEHGEPRRIAHSIYKYEGIINPKSEIFSSNLWTEVFKCASVPFSIYLLLR